MKTYCLKFIIISLLTFSFVSQANSQSVVDTSQFHPYHINYWVTIPILGVGAIGNYLGIDRTLSKKEISLREIEALNKEVINSFDQWSFKQDPAKIELHGKYSDFTLFSSLSLPGLLLFDSNIRQDWSDMLLLYLEMISITTNIYEWSFLGPNFQNRLRPVTYYDELTYDERKTGNSRNSFYSGHVASVAASTFFMAKVYSDYHPEVGNNKYLLYSAALVPPLVLGYFRITALRHFPSDVMVGVGVGALCGILIPEFHRLKVENVSMGFLASPESTGIAIKWQPDFLK